MFIILHKNFIELLKKCLHLFSCFFCHLRPYVTGVFIVLPGEILVNALWGQLMNALITYLVYLM